MIFDHKSIIDSFKIFWRSNKDSIKFYYNGESVAPEKISGFEIQLNEGEFGDGYNFHCSTLNMRVQIGCCEKPYKGDFYLKVLVKHCEQNGMPKEVIHSIKENTIFLKD